MLIEELVSVVDMVASGPGGITKIVSHLSLSVTITRGLTTSGVPIIGEAWWCSIVLF